MQALLTPLNPRLPRARPDSTSPPRYPTRIRKVNDSDRIPTGSVWYPTRIRQVSDSDPAGIRHGFRWDLTRTQPVFNSADIRLWPNRYLNRMRPVSDSDLAGMRLGSGRYPSRIQPVSELDTRVSIGPISDSNKARILPVSNSQPGIRYLTRILAESDSNPAGIRLGFPSIRLGLASI